MRSISAFLSVRRSRGKGMRQTGWRQDSTGQGSVTREDMEKAAAQFFAELEPVFASCQKPVVRAIMATTLSYLPISFHSPDELQSHIRNSLECCTDPAEKATCMELLLQMMEMDGYELV